MIRMPSDCWSFLLWMCVNWWSRVDIVNGVECFSCMSVVQTPHESTWFLRMNRNITEKCKTPSSSLSKRQCDGPCVTYAQSHIVGGVIVEYMYVRDCWGYMFQVTDSETNRQVNSNAQTRSCTYTGIRAIVQGPAKNGKKKERMPAHLCSCSSNLCNDITFPTSSSSPTTLRPKLARSNGVFAVFRQKMNSMLCFMLSVNTAWASRLFFEIS